MAKQRWWIVQQVTNVMTVDGLKLFLFEKGQGGHLGSTVLITREFNFIETTSQNL